MKNSKSIFDLKTNRKMSNVIFINEKSMLIRLFSNFSKFLIHKFFFYIFYDFSWFNVFWIQWFWLSFRREIFCVHINHVFYFVFEMRLTINVRVFFLIILRDHQLFFEIMLQCFLFFYDFVCFHQFCFFCYRFFV